MSPPPRPTSPELLEATSKERISGTIRISEFTASGFPFLAYVKQGKESLPSAFEAITVVHILQTTIKPFSTCFTFMYII